MANVHDTDLVDGAARQATLPRVLIADDEHLIAEGLAAAITALGYEVLGPVADGESAIQLARERLPDIALLDISMPGVGGLEAAAAIWDELGIPSVIVTAYADPANVRQAAEAGVFGYLIKPVGPNELRAAVEVARERAGSVDELENRIEQLERSLASRRVVEQAKWRLIETRGMTEPEAHAHLQREARATRRRLAEVAQSVLDGDAAA